MRFSFSLRVQVAVFSVLFAGGMWMSKIAQPLHFDNRGALVAFGIGYAVMAVVGGLSFAWGALADRIGGLNAMRIGAAAYAVGIGGRVLTDMTPSVLFSALAGIGASLALVGVRPWIRSQARDDEIPVVVAGRNLSTQVGIFVGTTGAAALFLLAGQTSDGPVWALATAPLFVLAGVVWLLIAGRPDSPKKAVLSSTGDRSDKTTVRPLAVKLALLGVLSGFYVSLVAPYVPLILTHAGLVDSGAAVCIALMSAAQIAATAWLTKKATSPRPFRLFVMAELGSALFTLAIAVTLQFSALAIIAIFIGRAALLAIAATAEETIQFAVIPAAAAGFVFGVSQTSFLVGDAVGGALGAIIWQTAGPVGMMLVAGAATLLNAVLLPLFLSRWTPALSNTDADTADAH